MNGIDRRAAAPAAIPPLAREPRGDDDPMMRIGITVTKKVGNAVVRNRVRRRLREIARMVIPGQARPGLDYVLVGRQGALKRDFVVLQQELLEALKKLKALGGAMP